MSLLSGLGLCIIELDGRGIGGQERGSRRDGPGSKEERGVDFREWS